MKSTKKWTTLGIHNYRINYIDTEPADWILKSLSNVDKIWLNSDSNRPSVLVFFSATPLKPLNRMSRNFVVN